MRLTRSVSLYFQPSLSSSFVFPAPRTVCSCPGRSSSTMRHSCFNGGLATFVYILREELHSKPHLPPFQLVVKNSRIDALTGEERIKLHFSVA